MDDDFGFEDSSRPLLAKRSRFDNEEKSRNGRSSKAFFLKLPDAIQTLAFEGVCLKWDQVSCCYEVLSGPLFEQRVKQLQRLYIQWNDPEMGRPFGIMHAYFTLIHGEKWEGTGSLFRPKAMDVPQSGVPPAPVLTFCDEQSNDGYTPVTPTYSISDGRPNDDFGWSHAPQRPSCEQHNTDTEISFPGSAEVRDDFPLFQVVLTS